MYRFLKIFLILYFGIPATGYNQIPNIKNPAQYQEKAYIHFNSGFLIPGERLFYKLYVQNESTSRETKLSKIGRVVLIDQENNQIFNHILNLENGSAYADFLIPSSIQTGTYKLIGYTKWMENYGNEGIFESYIHILNPFTADLDFKKLDDQNEKVVNHKSEPLQSNLELILSKNKFATRSEGILTIEGMSVGNLDRLSISIRKKDKLEFGVPQKFNPNRKKGKTNFSFKTTPEYRGRTFSGKILDSLENQVDETVKIFYSVPGSANQFRIFHSNKNGTFNFQIPAPISNPEVYLTAVSRSLDKPFIKLDTEKFIYKGEFELFDFSILNAEALREKAIHLQIENYYKEVKQDSIIPFKSNPIFYGNNAEVYQLDDYTRFETMDETFTEIIQFVSFRSKRKSPRLVIQDYSIQNTAEGTPLVLLDGQPIDEHEKIFNLDPRSIQEVRVVRDRYYYGPSFYQGILDIRSNNSRLVFSKKNRFQIQPTEVPKKYFSPNYEKTEKSNVPDFRYQLLWNPELKSNQIQFFTSDVTGFYNIDVVGFDKNGEFISLKSSFEVLE